ncbi:hypothetical protein, partial [Propionigenium maris]|uniref:hypothetical protein n=1 Tax=Propionigenium maris TaxID=45622 RepID=UPI002490276E
YIDPAIGVNAEMVISKYDKSNKEELERLSKDLKKWEKDFSKNEDIIDAHASKTWDEIYTLMELSLVVEEYDYFVARSESDTLLGVGVLDRGEGYTLSLNLRDPNALVVREKRQADVVGNVGTQIRNEMINWSFENGATEVISRPMSSRAKSSLKEIGFVDVERFF